MCPFLGERGRSFSYISQKPRYRRVCRTLLVAGWACSPNKFQRHIIPQPVLDNTNFSSRTPTDEQELRRRLEEEIKGWAMGNLPATSSHVSNRTSNGVKISTRSEPIAGQRVIQELAIVFSNSQSFTRSSGPEVEAARYREAFELLGLKCAALGGNAVLGTHVEIKQFGDGGGSMVVSCTGTACIVAVAGEMMS
jgi:uncharacterized protein YbjQ (UPF0145 family)